MKFEGYDDLTAEVLKGKICHRVELGKRKLCMIFWIPCPELLIESMLCLIGSLFPYTRHWEKHCPAGLLVICFYLNISDGKLYNYQGALR